MLMMITTQPISGQCLCGTVQYEIMPPYLDFVFCHCERCQKATGSIHSANIFLDPKQFKWVTGEKEVTLFLHPTADNYPRAFCKKCGSSVPRFARDGVRFMIPAGGLNEDPGITPTKNIFWSLKQPWDTCQHNLPTFDARPDKK
jgi:hypothetical protein